MSPFQLIEASFAALMTLDVPVLRYQNGAFEKTSETSTMYEWIKALHVIAVIAWMAGMLYLPRLFVYHCEAEAGSKQSETFKVMERRLLKAIINPAMIVTWLAGLYFAWAGHWFSAPAGCTANFCWWYCCQVSTVFLPAASRISPPTETPEAQKFYRIINEVPTILMIGIVILVVVKPF